MNKFKSKYLKQEWNVPFFVKLDPNYENLFEREKEILKNEEGKFGVRTEGSDSAVEYSYDTFFEAYYNIETYLSNDTIIWSVELGKEVFKDDEELLTSGTYFKKSGEDSYSMFFSSNGDSNIEMLESDYQDWLGMNSKLTVDSFNSENFYAVYEWISHHPDFWRQKLIAKDKQPRWETDRGAEWMYSFPFIKAEEGKDFPPVDPALHEMLWCIESGSHVLKDPHQPDLLYCSTRYVDPEVSGYGETYEAAFLDFAKKYFIKRPWKNEE